MCVSKDSIKRDASTIYWFCGAVPSVSITTRHPISASNRSQTKKDTECVARIRMKPLIRRYSQHRQNIEYNGGHITIQIHPNFTCKSKHCHNTKIYSSYTSEGLSNCQSKWLISRRISWHPNIVITKFCEIPLFHPFSRAERCFEPRKKSWSITCNWTATTMWIRQLTSFKIPKIQCREFFSLDSNPEILKSLENGSEDYWHINFLLESITRFRKIPKVAFRFSNKFIDIRNQNTNSNQNAFDTGSQHYRITFSTLEQAYLQQYPTNGYGESISRVGHVKTELKTKKWTVLKRKIPPTILLLTGARQRPPTGWPTRHRSNLGQLLMFCTRPCSFAEAPQLLWGWIPW